MTEQTLRGVNLGGWLVLEKWMTPSLFKGTEARDEHQLLQTKGGRERIEHHRRTFIVEDDFAWLHANGLNAVRIPIGYWALESDAPFVAATRELDWAMEMAKKYGLQVIIDLHGLKGSQNGQDHSGQAGESRWYKKPQYRQDTLVTLEALAKRYKDYDNFWGLQIINEPKIGLLQLKLRRFYAQAYVRLSRILKPHTRIIFSDAFTPRLLSGALGGRKSHPVVMDIHLYHMATLFSQYLSVGWFMGKTVRRGRMLKRLARKQPIIIGEWSGVMRHETMRRIPQDQHEALIRDYMQLQLDLFSISAGWFYWNYKTEAPGVWNFRSQLEGGSVTLPS
jgi:glucan 1,3-beta-glucosidase